MRILECSECTLAHSIVNHAVDRGGRVVVELVPHDAAWAGLYESAAAGIRGALGSTVLSVHHVGSTAIPGILTKPTIDILVLVERYDPEAAYRCPLESLGYAFGHRDETHVFFEGSPVGVPTHVHVVEDSSEDSRMMIAFRDYLRAHPDEAHRYEELKNVLANRCSDSNAYADAKSAYLWGIVRRAGSRASRDPPGT